MEIIIIKKGLENNLVIREEDVIEKFNELKKDNDETIIMFYERSNFTKIPLYDIFNYIEEKKIDISEYIDYVKKSLRETGIKINDKKIIELVNEIISKVRSENLYYIDSFYGINEIKKIMFSIIEENIRICNEFLVANINIKYKLLMSLRVKIKSNNFFSDCKSALNFMMNYDYCFTKAMNEINKEYYEVKNINDIANTLLKSFIDKEINEIYDEFNKVIDRFLINYIV